MANIAILIGIAQYRNLPTLECCDADVDAIAELLNIAGRFDNVQIVKNADSSALKDAVRKSVDKQESIEEIFFYFSGHGYQHDSEFYFCATDFDSKRPNETGLSTSELQTLLRSAEAELVVKVIDACSSGALLLKSDGSFITQPKDGFKHLIQIASCLDSQSSLTGNPLSQFTESFRSAVLQKEAGVIYYTDVINALRDQYIDNNAQTPHFISQGTGREQFADDAKKFDILRGTVNQGEEALAELEEPTEVDLAEPSIVELLEKAESKFASKDLVVRFISGLFDGVEQAISDNETFEDLFDSTFTTHNDFQESATRAFIIRALQGEKKPDNFVTATISREHKRRDLLGIAGLAGSLFGSPDDSVTHYDLSLNCNLEKVQFKVTLTPKFSSLMRFTSIITCAPSLERCYVFEFISQHALQDWKEYDPIGTELNRRWWRVDWNDDPAWLIGKMTDRLLEALNVNIEATKKALETIK